MVDSSTSAKASDICLNQVATTPPSMVASSTSTHTRMIIYGELKFSPNETLNAFFVGGRGGVGGEGAKRGGPGGIGEASVLAIEHSRNIEAAHGKCRLLRSELFFESLKAVKVVPAVRAGYVVDQGALGRL